jgi:ribonuclease HI
MELSEYVVDFEKRSVIKSQILADFVAEWTESGSLEEGIVPESPWLVYCDESWGSARAGIVAILISPIGIKVCYAASLQFTNKVDKCINNIVKYEAILLGLRKLRAIGVQTCTLRTNSRVVASQIEKECITREPTFERYLALVRRMKNYFKGFMVEHIKRSKNSEVDELAKATACNMLLHADVFFQVVPDALIKTVKLELRVINLIEGEDWRAPIMSYLFHYYEPDNAIEHTRMQQR